MRSFILLSLASRVSKWESMAWNPARSVAMIADIPSGRGAQVAQRSESADVGPSIGAFSGVLLVSNDSCFCLGHPIACLLALQACQVLAWSSVPNLVPRAWDYQAETQPAMVQAPGAAFPLFRSLPIAQAQTADPSRLARAVKKPKRSHTTHGPPTGSSAAPVTAGPPRATSGRGGWQFVPQLGLLAHSSMASSAGPPAAWRSSPHQS
ncbi:hypothetical protein NDU88_007329 [Pleurodeles waltl]|uniref:Uncharacterized protein n=1 Tax=Pleurodeles waltl TaxID=8319 RepID=A0AAV7TZF2_PLEWA|nr:hypothetical protein NDU88_007329 [Pleurodeles waltl]